MSVSYSITTNAGNTTKHMHAACFANHYGQLRNYKTLTIYVDKTWMAERKPGVNYYGKSLGRTAFTSEDYFEYTRLLRTMGMKFTITEEEKQFVFVVSLTDQKMIGIKLTLNAIRYLCEDPYPTIVKEFLKLSKQRMAGVTTFTKFLLAHQCELFYHGGHTFIPCYNLPLLISNKDLKEKLINNDRNDQVTMVIPKCTKVFNERIDLQEPDKYGNRYKYEDHRNALFDLFGQGAPLKDIYKKYKELCAKFM